MGGTVANRFTPVNVAYLQNSALQPDDLTHRIGAARLRVDAIERGAGAHEVKVKLRPEKHAGGRSKTGGQVGEAPSRSCKALELDVIERMPWFVRTGEMAHHCTPSNRIEVAQHIGKFVEFPDGQTEASHAGIEVQDSRCFPARSGQSPFGDLPRIIKDRNEAEFGKVFFATR